MLVGGPCYARQQRPQLGRPALGAVVAAETRRAFQLGDERVQGSVAIGRGTLIAELGRGDAVDAGTQRLDQPRLADAGLARQQHRPTLTSDRFLPAIEKQSQLLLATDE